MPTDGEKLRAFVNHREHVAVFDHDPPDPLRGHESCGPRCRPVDRFSRGDWVDDEGRPVIDPDEIGRLEAARIAQGRGELGLVNLARDLIADALIGGVAYSRFSNANAATGVGDSNTGFDVAQTDLQGAAYPTNKLRRAMDPGYPIRASNAITWRSTFATGDANFHWQERGIFNSATAGVGQMLNRHVVDLGTKTSAFSWQISSVDSVVLA